MFVTICKYNIFNFLRVNIFTLIKTYNICHIHIALCHVQQQLKSSDPKQFYKHFPRINQTAFVKAHF